MSELIADHLTANPRQLHPPLLKRLIGAYSHLYQFQCGKSHRLLYSVDDERHVVRIEYLGTHPE